MKLGFIGCGNMAQAMITGFIGQNVIPAEEIIAADPASDKIEEVKEIIRLGTQIDLWQIELPEKTQQTKSGETNERSMRDRNVGPFEITGLLKDFVELEEKIDKKLNSKNM